MVAPLLLRAASTGAPARKKPARIGPPSAVYRVVAPLRGNRSSSSTFGLFLGRHMRESVSDTFTAEDVARALGRAKSCVSSTIAEWRRNGWVMREPEVEP